MALVANAATRPHYGGTLRLEIPARLTVPDPTESLDVSQAEAAEKLRELIYDHLVRLDTQGLPQPAIALSWEHDGTAAKWQFKIRPGVKWQDGAALTLEEVATALEGKLPNASVRASGDAVEIDTRSPSPGLLTTLATNVNLCIRRVETTSGDLPLPIGTGPYRLMTWEAGSRAVLQANDDYWDGRALRRYHRDPDGPRQPRGAARFGIGEGRRGGTRPGGGSPRPAGRQEGLDLRRRSNSSAFASAPRRAAVQDRRLREALADSIDRTAIQKVLLQNYGEVAGSIFPQWLSGYTFLFPTAMNLDQARQLRGGDRRGADAQDGLRSRRHAGPPDGRARGRERARCGHHASGRAAPAGRGERTTDPRVDLRVERVRIDGPTLDKGCRRRSKASAPGHDRRAGPAGADLRRRTTICRFPGGHSAHPHPGTARNRSRGSWNWSATPWGAWRLEHVSLEGEKP